MFFGVGFLVLLLLTTYSFVRIRVLFATKKQRIVFAIVYWVLVLSFPWVEVLSHSGAPAWTDPLLLLGYLSLPYLLYLFLFVATFDILKGINRIFRIVPPKNIRTGKAPLISAVLLFLLPAVVVSIGMVRNNLVQVNEFQVDIPRRSSSPREWTIAVASDFHLGTLTDRDFMLEFVRKVNALDADLLLLPGDLIEANRQGMRTGEFAQDFRNVTTRYGIFATPGNHESFGRGYKIEFFERAGITLLCDSVVTIDSALRLVGRNDSRSERRKPINELMEGSRDSLPVIVLDHKPTDLENIRAAGADIVVCGHTHDGQLWPMNYITAGIYDVSWGYKRFGTLHAFVTSGVQVWGPPVRTAGDSEIMLLHVVAR